MNYRELIKDKKKIVVKIGSSSITHESTGNINYRKLEKLVRILCDIKNQGKDVVLVSSGAIAVGRQTVGIKRSNVLAEKQACAAIGQCRLMMTYQKLFSEYNQVAAQVLLTKYTMQNHESVVNAKNTFEEPECVTVKKYDGTQITEKGIRFTIPACSVLHLEVR